MDIKLKIGDIVIDVITNDVGLLVRRYCLFEPLNEYGILTYEDELNIWAWEIFWVGPAGAGFELSRYQPYTESGLFNLINTGTFILKERKEDE